MQRLLSRVGLLGVGLATVGATINSTLYNVDGGERAVLFDRFRGVLPTVSGEGTHFLIPWVQLPIIYSVRSTPRSIPVTTGSKGSSSCSTLPLAEHFDLQNVNITLRILFRPNEKQLPWIYANIGQDYDEKILPSITTEVLKAVVAQFDASELITQREVVSEKVQELLMERGNSFGLILDDISITHLTFGREFTEAVEMKQVAQQEAERARFLVEKAEQIKQANIIRSEGDSIAAKMLAEAFVKAGDGLIELRRLEAAEEIATMLSQSRNVAYLPGGGQNLLLNIPTN